MKTLLLTLCIVTAPLLQAQKVSDLPAASSAADADLSVIVQGGVTKKATVSLLRATTISQVSGLQTALDARASLSGSYVDPSWITAMAWSKITGKPTTLSGYGITDAATAAQGALAATAVQPGAVLNITTSAAWPPAIQAYSTGSSGNGVYAEASGSSAVAVHAKNSGAGIGLEAYSDTGKAISIASYTGTAISAAVGGSTGTGADISAGTLPLQISNTGSGTDIAKFRRATSTLVAIENSSSILGRIRLAGGATAYTGTLTAPGLNTASRTWTLPDATGTVALTSDITKSAVSLGNVENTALSTWAGSGNITTVGTLASGAIPWSLVTSKPTLGTAAATDSTAYATAAQGAKADTAVQPARAISTTAPLTGGGTLAADLTLAVSAASTNATGISQLATDAEIQTGTDTAKVIRPSGLTAWWTWIKTQAQTIAGNWTFNGIISAPNQTTASGSNLMNRDNVSSYFPSITQYAQPTTRFLGPLVAHAALGATSGLNTYYEYFTPIFSGSSRTIDTMVFEVTTALASSTIEVAAYNTRSSTDALPGTQIANSSASISGTSTGVKTITFSPTWTAPKGLFYIGAKVKCATGSGAFALRAFDGTGRDNALLGALLFGYDPTSPTTSYAVAGTPFLLRGDNVSIISDASASSFSYFTVGSPTLGIFVK